MVTKTSMNIQAVDQSGNKVQKTLTDINPDASPAKLKEFAEALNGLTNNVYGSANRIEVKNLGGGNLLDPGLHWNSNAEDTTFSVTITKIMEDTTHDTREGEPELCGTYIANINFAKGSTQRPYIKSNGTQIPAAVGSLKLAEGPVGWTLYIAAGWHINYSDEGDILDPPYYGDIVVAVDPDDTYDGAEITLTITEG